MEPPPKRLRILQSVDVDEDSPGYVEAKQRQQRRFKGRLESIFAKFGNMHESMSDEIDMRDNTVVVDRGHLRRLERQVGRSETMLLDTLGVTANPELEHTFEQDEDEGAGGDSEDELAPTQLQSSRKRSLEDPEETDQTALPNSEPAAAPASQPVAPPSESPIPTVNLLNLVQFPQTPAGQQAQATFYATLTQTINQAVQQAVAPLFSGLLPSNPHSSLPSVDTPIVPITPAQIKDSIAPATDPKWYFPPLAAGNTKPPAIQSSPITALSDAEISDFEWIHGQDISTKLPAHKKARVKPRVMEKVISTLAHVDASMEDQPESASYQRSPLTELFGKPRGPTRKFVWTMDDDMYICEKKGIQNRSWQEIKAGKEKWKDRPLHVFRIYWSRYLKPRGLHLSAPINTHNNHKSTEPMATYGSTSPQSQSHHLPTPSSLEHEDSCKELEDRDAEQTVDDNDDSNGHFNEDERDLLSLAGADTDPEKNHMGENDEAPALAPEDVVLPSVEMEEFVDQVTKGILETSPAVEATPGTLEGSLIIERAPTITEGSPTVELTPTILERSPTKEATLAVQNIKIEPSASPPPSKKARKITSPRFQAEAESEFEQEDLDQDVYENAEFSRQTTRRQSSSSVDSISEDEFEPIITPKTKRTPPASFLFSTPALQTSSSFAQHSGTHSSGSKSTSKLDRRAFLKQVKQSWTKKSARGQKLSTKTSFQSLPMKRAWIDDSGNSEDDLA